MPKLVTWKSHRSCRLRDRQKKKLQVRRAAVGVIKVINAMHDGRIPTKLTSPGSEGGSRMKETAARLLAVGHILSRVAMEVRERRSLGLTGVQSLASLLKAPLDEAGYVRPTGVRQVPMMASRTVEPKTEGYIDMLTALPYEDASYYELEERVVETHGKCSVLFNEIENRYGFIGGELSEFFSYLRRDDVRPLWEWDLMSNIRAIAGVSTVLKKNGVDQRKLIMQCAANYMFGDPTARAHLGMGGGSSLSRVFVTGDNMEVAACDEDSAFTYVKVPPWMARWQATPPVLAIDAWDLLDSGLRESIPSPSTTHVAPKYLRLAMGGSHSVYILMRINIHHVGSTLFNYASRLNFSRVQQGEVGCDQACEIPGDVALDDISIGDEDWCNRQHRRRGLDGASKGWTVDAWCEEVRATKHGDDRTFVVIHMFAGERREGDIQEHLERMMNGANIRLLMLSVDLAEDPEWDFANPNTFTKLLGLAEEGLVDVFFGGPPCSTVARSRFVHIPGGPRPLRFRWELWGRRDLTHSERERVEEANLLWLNFLAMAEAVASRGGSYLWEHPADPGCDPYPSIWATDEMCNFEARVGGRRVHLHQCPFGGLAPKLTTLSGNLDGMEVVDGVRCPGVSDSHQHGISIGRNPAGGFYTKRLQTYPPKLCEALAVMIFKTLQRFAVTLTGPTGALHLVDQKAAPRVSSWSTSCSSRQVGIAMLNEATARSFSLRVHDRQAGAYIHVDDAVFIGSASDGPVHCNRLLDKAVSGLEKVGFQVSQQFRAGSLDKVVGYEVVQRPAEFRLPRKKMALLREALLFLVNQKVVNVKVLHSLIGMWIFGALLRRDLLSIPHAVFRFVEHHAEQSIKWWPVARDEVRAMAYVVPLMVCHVGSPIWDWLFSTDAMGANETDYGGYGIAVTRISDSEIDDLLRQGEAVGCSIAGLDGLHGAKYPEKALVPTVPFTLLAPQLFEESRWLEVEHGRWRFGDHITIGESRTVLKMLRRVSSWPGLHGVALFSLQDNMPTACSMTKGRSPSFPLNRVLRMKAAACLAARLRVFLPWVESALQPADSLSRLLW